jgi:hypothetical protein
MIVEVFVVFFRTEIFEQYVRNSRWLIVKQLFSFFDQYPLYRRLGGPQSRSGHRLEEKSFAPAGDRTPIARSSST